MCVVVAGLRVEDESGLPGTAVGAYRGMVCELLIGRPPTEQDLVRRHREEWHWLPRTARSGGG